jgi:hypothetical protein
MKHFEFIMANVIWVVVALALQEPVTPPQSPPPMVSDRQVEDFLQDQKRAIEKESVNWTFKQCERAEQHFIHGYPDALPVFNK